MDNLTHEQRSKIMQSIKGKNTNIELALRKVLWEKGLRYRKNDATVFGKPDFCFKGLKIAVFCDSEFWHGKDWDEKKLKLKSNLEFWNAKIERNIQRDKEVTQKLEQEGWQVIRFWGEEINHDIDNCTNIIIKAVTEAKRKNKHTALSETNDAIK